MDILGSCEIHEVSPGPMIHTQPVPQNCQIDIFYQNSFSGYYNIVETGLQRGFIGFSNVNPCKVDTRAQWSSGQANV